MIESYSTTIHPAIERRLKAFCEVHYNFDIGPDFVDMEHIMQENMEYVLQYGCNCQVFSSALEGSVLDLVIPSVYKSREKFTDNKTYQPLTETDVLEPGDLFLFGPQHQDTSNFDTRFLHQATFTGAYTAEGDPVLAHMPGHYKKKYNEAGIPKQKIPGPRKWIPSQFNREFRGDTGHVWVVKRPDYDNLVKNGAVLL